MAQHVYVFHEREIKCRSTISRGAPVGRLSHSRRQHAQFPLAIEIDVMPHLLHENCDISATRRDFSTSDKQHIRL